MNSSAIPERHEDDVELEDCCRNSRSQSWDGVWLTESRLGDSDLPAWTATRASVRLQMSSPVVVELGLRGRYQRRLVGPGTFCIIPEGGGAPAARWRGERRILQAEFSPALVRSVAESHNLQSVELIPKHAISDPRVSHLLLALREEMLNAHASGQAYVEMIARAVAIRLLHSYAVAAPLRALSGGLSRPLLRRVMEYIEAHADRNVGLRNLAAISGLSEDHFARAFRETTGMPPHRFVIRRRLARARHLLETSKTPIAEIAHSLGFADQSHLTNMFRRNLGLTPGQVRANSERTLKEPRNSTNDAGIFQEFNESLRLISL